MAHRRPNSMPMVAAFDGNRVSGRTGRLARALADGPPWPDAALFVLIDAVGFTRGFLRDATRPPTRDQLVTLFKHVRGRHPCVIALGGVVRDLVDGVTVTPC